ncbi:MAG: long-chain-fatty-acid--CoA ligase [Armatimonadota bacterium]|nr:long-chain-fatty-acid--CoA ligase [Armatimonadota bacterium]MDW8156005.1 long-chain-fatty-acid--CoA ligase [Armatimonadota bacterium]
MRTPLTPLQFVRRAVDVYADRVAVVDGAGRFTYAQFGQRCGQLAAALRTLGLAAGDRVAVLAPNTHRALEVYTAVPLAGCVVVPLNTRLREADYEYILRHSGTRLLLADPSFSEVAESVARRVEGLRVVRLDAEGSDALMAEVSGAAARAAWHRAEEVDEHAPITLNYTSGTTAHPKGVVLTHRNAALNVLNVVVHGRLHLEDAYLHVLPMFHVNGWGAVWAVSAVGARHVCLPKVDPPEVFRLVDREGVTVAFSAPTVLVMLLNDPAARGWKPRQSLRWYVGGAPPPAALIARAEGELGIEVVHVYGLTETGPWLTVCEWPREWDSLPLEERAARKARQGVGQLLCGEVAVVREDLSPVARDGREVGEIVVRGPTVMDGYYQDPEATAEAFRGGWFHTGDLAVVHPDGYLQIVDRKKDIIISGGENISSVEVEAILYQHPAVMEAAVVGVPDPKWGEVPKAFVVLRPGMQATADELVAFCRDRLAHFKAPKAVEFVSELPKTATGKIQKFLLRARSGA